MLGEISDVGAGKGSTLAKLAARSQAIADVTILVGAWASSALKAREPGRDDGLLAFSYVRDACEYLNSIVREGDLVLLKGTNRQDHLSRIILAREGDLACWRDDCKRYQFWNECPDRNKPSGAPLLLSPASVQTAASAPPGTGLTPLESDEQVIVGLGNPEAKYAGTPHNIGYELVDQLASSWGLAWADLPEAWLARGVHQGRAVCLVKVRLAMNGTGAGLKRLAEVLSFTPARTILVYDDLALAVGTMRARLSGGAGGHRGVASVMEAFQTDAFRRVKVGIGHTEAHVQQRTYVLTPWAPAIRPTVDMAIQTGMARVGEMIAHPPKAP